MFTDSRGFCLSCCKYKLVKDLKIARIALGQVAGNSVSLASLE